MCAQNLWVLLAVTSVFFIRNLVKGDEVCILLTEDDQCNVMNQTHVCRSPKLQANEPHRVTGIPIADCGSISGDDATFTAEKLPITKHASTGYNTHSSRKLRAKDRLYQVQHYNTTRNHLLKYYCNTQAKFYGSTVDCRCLTRSGGGYQAGSFDAPSASNLWLVLCCVSQRRTSCWPSNFSEFSIFGV